MDVSNHTVPEHLYHLLLTTTHIQKNPNHLVEKIGIPGTYTSLLAVKAASHSCLFDAGYERDSFDIYETKPGLFEGEHIPERSGLVIFAVSPDGTQFRVRLTTTPNDRLLNSDADARGRISRQLYYVILAKAEFNAEEGRTVRDVNVERIFETYKEARDFASHILLSKEEGITKESFSEYSEAALNERDCGYGENVVVHAVSKHGINHLVSVIKTQELEAVHLAEATMKIV